MLLQLPLELFENVLEAVVLGNGLRQAIKTRLVCRAFKDGIIQAVCSTQTLENDKDIIYHGQQLTSEYLAMQTIADRACTLPLSRIISDTIKCILRYQNRTGDENLRVQYTRALCLARVQGYSDQLLEQGSFEGNLESSSLWEMQPDIGPSHFPQTLLAAAAYLDIPDLFQELVKEKIVAEFSCFGSPLCIAARRGNLEMTQLVLDNCLGDDEDENVGFYHYDENNELVRKRGTEFIIAASHGQLEILKLLTTSKIPESKRKYSSWRTCKYSILRAAYFGHGEVIQFLLQHAETSGHRKMLRYRRGWKEMETVYDGILWEAARGGHLSLVQEAVNKGADIDKLNYPQDYKPPYTALGHASRSGNETVARFLLDNGASVSNAGPNQPLLLAIQGGWLQLIQLLINRGGAVNPTFKEYFLYRIPTLENLLQFPLYAAVAHGQTDCVRLLLENGACLVAETINIGSESYLLAASHRYTSIMRILVECGFDASSVNGVIDLTACSEVRRQHERNLRWKNKATMLLDLPGELLELIMEAVVNNGLDDALEARLVCKSFDNGIIRAVYTTGSLEAPGAAFPYSSSKRLMSEFLIWHVLADRTFQNPISKAISDSLDYILEYQGKKKDDSIRISYLRTLCFGAVESGMRGGPNTEWNLVYGLLSATVGLPRNKIGGTRGQSAATSHRTHKLLTNVVTAAARLGILGLVRKLVLDGIRDDETFFGIAFVNVARQGDLPLLKDLLEHYAFFPRWAIAALSDEAVRAAILQGHINIVQYFLDIKVEYLVNLTVWQYYEVLMGMASSAGHLDIALLVAKYADAHGLLDRPWAYRLGLMITPRNIIHNLLLVTAARYGHQHIVQHALKNGACPKALVYRATSPREPLTALVEATKGGYESIIRVLLERGAQVNTPEEGDSRGKIPQPLVHAVRHGWLQIAEILIKEGANVNPEENIQSKNRVNLPLAVALQRGRTKCVNLLLKNGAKLSQESLCQKDYDEIMGLLDAHRLK